MDVEYARLARDLELPKGISAVPKANVIENAAASYKSPNAATSEVNVSYERRIKIYFNSCINQAEASGSSPIFPEEEDDLEEGGLC